MNHSNDQEWIELQIANLVAEFVETAEGQRQTAAELIAEHPELAPGLEECLRGLDLVQRGKSGFVDQETNPETIVPIEPRSPEIPDYEVIGELGRGGMGVVYEARQISLDRIVALKVLPIGSVDPRAVERFRREAETVATLEHGGIVPVYAVGVCNGLHWFAMQRIDGRPLNDWFKQQSFRSRIEAVNEVVRVGIEAAEALEHAHRRGVIHRDVKPGNLLVDTTGKVWLTDFGLARRDVDVTATATGAMLGTPRYMSAEQISRSDEQIDARTDVYSLGATLYELAVGRPVFEAQSPLKLLTKIQQDEPVPLRRVDPSVPRSLELVILKCLDKEPRRRYESAAELAADLKALRDDRPISARGLPIWVTAARVLRRNQRQVSTIASAVAATAAVLVLLGFLWQQHQRANLGRVRISTPAGLYVANIQQQHSPSDVDALDAVLVTTPMQQAIELPSGEYNVRLEGVGRLSQTSELRVAARDLAELEYVDRSDPPLEIDIHDKMAVSIADDALAVLDQESLAVYESGGAQRFSIHLSEFASGLEQDALTEDQTSSDDDPPISFGFDSDQMWQGDYNVPHSGFARIERISSPVTGDAAIDFDSDQRADLLLTAQRHAAIAAVSHDGTLLWNRRLPMSFEDSVQRQRYPRKGLPAEAIVGIMPVGDLNDDRIADLIVNAALFDASGYSRPLIFTLSGSDGSEIAALPMATVNMEKTPHWPWSGLLRRRRGFTADQRKSRITYARMNDSSHRAPITSLQNMNWGGNTNDSALYVLPPLVVDADENEPVAATATAQAIHFFHVASGEEVCAPVPLPKPICRGPIRVKLPDAKFGVMVMTGVPSSTWTKCALHLCAMGEPAPRWSAAQNVGALDFVAGAAESSFPMAADLDTDGVDEIITSINAHPRSEWPQLLCYSADTGQLRWTSQHIAGLATAADKGLPLVDIDQDGVIDLAIVGVASHPRTRAPQAAGLRLAIDFVSGRTGERIGFREERISGEEPAVVEIDSVELSGHNLVCSVVYGTTEELKLSSLTIALDLRQLTPAIVARGLTRLEGSDDFTNHPKGRWYRRRSGPYAASADDAVWIEDESTQAWIAGDQLITSWRSSDGRPRVLLHGRSIRCIDATDRFMLWQQDLLIDANGTFCLPGPDGTTDLLLQQSFVMEAAPAFYDAETGRLKFQIDSPPMGEIRYLESDKEFPQRYVYALADREFQIPGQRLNNTNQGYLLLKIDRERQQVVWSKPCYQVLSARASWHQPSEMLQFDVDGDSVIDLITANTDLSDTRLEALNGLNGEILWSAPLAMRASKDSWPWNVRWPLMSIVASGNRDYLVVVDAVSSDNKAVELKCFDLRDGKVLSKLRMPLVQQLRFAGRSMSMHVIAPEKRDGLFGMPTTSSNGRGPFWAVLMVDERGRLAEVDRFPASHAIMTADIDHDETIERIDIFSEKAEIHRADTNELIASFDLPQGINNRRLETIGENDYLVGYLPDQDHVWIKLPGGEVSARVSRGLLAMTHHQTEYPRMLVHSGGTLLIGSTPEGPVSVGVSLEAPIPDRQRPASFPVAMRAPEADARYTRPISVQGIYHGKSLAEVLRLAILAAGALALPVFYLQRLIRRRQWSLRWLLFAPAVTLLALYAWRTLVMQPQGIWSADVLVGLLAALGTWALFSLLIHQHWKMLAIGVGLSIFTATLLMYGTETAMAARTPGLVGYWTAGNWFAAVAAVASQVIMPLAVVTRWQSAMESKKAVLGIPQ